MTEEERDAMPAPTPPAASPATPRHAPRRRRRVVLAIAGAVVLAGAATAVVLWTRSGAHPVSVDDATRPTGSTMPVAPSVLRPAQGVYSFEGSGTDRLDKPPKEQAEGPQMPATVSHRADGCWTFRIDYSSNHWQSWIYCPRPDGGLEEHGGESYQRWDFGVFATDTTSTFTCADAVVVRAGQEAGDTWTQTCSGTSTGSEGETSSSGPYTYVGPDQVEVGDEEVSAFHYRRQRTMSGAQIGTEDAEVWFAADTGLPLRNVRTVQAGSATIIGQVNYSEEASFQATAIAPSP